MKSILMDDDLHYLLRCVALKNNKKLNATLNEAVIDIANKYKVEIKQQLKIYQNKDKIIS